jgi:biotin operon repressor
LKSSKKLKDKIFDQPYEFLSIMRYGSTSPKLISDELGISKQNVNYSLKKLLKEGIVIRPSKGCYLLTKSGKRIHDQYERFRNKQLIRIENMRVTFIVEKGGSELEKRLISHKHELQNNVKIYHATLNFHSTRLIVTNSEYTLEVTITNTLDIDLNEAYHQSMLEAYGVAMYLEKWFNVEFSEGQRTGKPEIAIPCPYASALLLTTGASQIRTNKAIMNRSKGRGADMEVYNLQDAQKVVNMPNTLTSILDELDIIKKQNANSSPFYSDLAGNYPMRFI